MIGAVVGKKGQVDMTVVPFAGGAPIVTNLMGGQIASGVTGAPEAVQMLKSGKVNVLGISGAKRSPYLPTVPTFEELGYPGLTAESWFAVYSPKGLPEPLAEKFNKALNVALADPKVKQQIVDLSLQATPTTRSEANTEFTKAVAFWRAATPAPAPSR
jgi:tripartite-type tricarboxylate transporter receptor subunit TctC